MVHLVLHVLPHHDLEDLAAQPPPRKHGARLERWLERMQRMPGLGWMDGGWIVSLPLLLALRDPLNLGALGSMRKNSRRTDARAAVG